MRATYVVLWNQKGTDAGSLLFAGMARSYSGSLHNRHSTNDRLGGS